MADKKFGIVVYGATGFTGRLVCEYLNQRLGINGEISWAMAGRSLDKLKAVRDKMNIDKNVPLVVADAADRDSLKAMVESTGVLLTTVGPFQLYGSNLVAACAEAGTDYVDLCGEPVWMHDMIKAYSDKAKSSRTRIVFSCGFDSIPSDLGVLSLQQAAREKFGSPFSRVKGRLCEMKGEFSGGTAASFKETMKLISKDPSVYQLMINPFSLSEGFTGPKQPSGLKPKYDEDLGSWSAPFFMAPINTKNVHRSNFLMGHDYGTDFVYDEMTLTGPGDEGEAMANSLAEDKSMATSSIKPGEGPDKEMRDAGFYSFIFVGKNEEGQSLKVRVTGDKDPGYGSTAKIISESAICLLMNPDLAGGGIWTPASAMGSSLIEPLQQYAGLSFEFE